MTAAAGAPTAVLVLHHDYGSPASAVAVLRVERVAEVLGAAARVRVAPFAALPLEVAVPPGLDVLAELDALRDDAAAEGLLWRRPSALPPTTAAHVVGHVAEAAGRGRAWRSACYRALWQDGADLADPALLLDLATRVGLDPTAVAGAIDDRVALAAARRRAGRARRDGVGGVPVLQVGRTLLPGLLAEDALVELLAGT